MARCKLTKNEPTCARGGDPDRGAGLGASESGPAAGGFEESSGWEHGWWNDVDDGVGNGPGWGVGAEFCPVGSVEAEIAGSSGDGPPTFVDEDMMVTAEEDQIVDVGLTAVRPMGEMVDIAPG